MVLNASVSHFMNPKCFRKNIPNKAGKPVEYKNVAMEQQLRIVKEEENESQKKEEREKISFLFFFLPKISSPLNSKRTEKTAFVGEIQA